MSQEVEMTYEEKKVVHMLRTLGANSAGFNKATGAAIAASTAREKGVDFLPANGELHRLARVRTNARD